MTQKRYRIEDSLGLPAAPPPGPGASASSERLEEIFNAIQDLRRVTQMSASETIESCRRPPRSAFG
ncbi:hypothetical protein OMR07_13295 [Methylobacterium organophilum]|nr:hypothetical protein [Methylobacterium organophilum]